MIGVIYIQKSQQIKHNRYHFEMILEVIPTCHVISTNEKKHTIHLYTQMKYRIKNQMPHYTSYSYVINYVHRCNLETILTVFNYWSFYCPQYIKDSQTRVSFIDIARKLLSLFLYKQQKRSVIAKLSTSQNNIIFLALEHTIISHK